MAACRTFAPVDRAVVRDYSRSLWQSCSRLHAQSSPRLRMERVLGSTRWGPSPRELGLLVLLSALSLGGCRQNTASEIVPEDAEPVVKVKVRTAGLEDWPRVVRVQGSLLADEISVVGAKVAGRVKQVNVDLGSVVADDAVLVTLDSEDLDLKVQQAEAQLEQVRAKLGLKPGDKEEGLNRARVPSVVQEEAIWKEALANLERGQLLVQERAMPVEELQQRQAAAQVAEAKYRAALNDVDEQVAMVGVKRAELGLAKQARDDGVIRAPFDGMIQQRHVAPGSYLQVGQAVVTLVRTNPVRFRASVPERDAPQVRLGQTARVGVEGESAELTGKVTRVSPALDLSSRSLVVEVDLPNPDGRLHVGLFAEGDLVIDAAAKTLAVPQTAIYEFAGVEKVWVVRDGRAAERAVQTGRRSGTKVEIRDGLTAGDLVIENARQGRIGPVTADEEGKVKSAK